MIPTTEPAGLVQIPPVIRTALYYALALASAILIPLTAAGYIAPMWGQMITGVAAIFGFTLAAQHVPKTD